MGAFVCLECIPHSQVYIVHRCFVLDDTLEGVLQFVAEAYAKMAHVDTYHGVNEHTVHLVFSVEHATYTSRHEGRHALVQE